MLVKRPTCVPCGPAEISRKTSQAPRTQQKKPRKPTPHQTDKLHHTEQWKPQVDQIHHVNSSLVFHFLLSSGNNGAWPQILLLLRTFVLALSPHGRSASAATAIGPTASPFLLFDPDFLTFLLSASSSLPCRSTILVCQSQLSSSVQTRHPCYSLPFQRLQ